MSKSQSAAGVDPLTGLKTYESFIKDFEALSVGANEKCEDLSLITLDIDRFMRINEQFGRAAGDIVIKTLASHLSSTMLESALLYRYGGDQFAVLMPSTPKEQAFLLMEKCRESFLAKGVPHGGSTLEISFSAGVSCCPEDGARTAEIVRKAEGALFRAKASGANKVCLSREEKMVTKTSHYTYEQLQRLSQLAKKEGVGEAVLLREALDDLLKKYDD